jgi:hypothetical protein
VEHFKHFAIFENLDIFKLVAMDCLYKTDYFFSLKAVTLMPLAMCVVLYILWLRGKYVFQRKLALYPRFCTKCHHPIDPFELMPSEKILQQKLKDENRKFELFLHNWFTYFRGKEYVYQVNNLHKAHNHPGFQDKNLKFMNKAIVLNKAVNKLKNLRTRKDKSISSSLLNSGEQERKSKNGSKIKKVQHEIHHLHRTNESKDFKAYNSFCHQHGCPKGNPPQTKQTSVGNWRMRVLLRMRFQHYKSKCMQILFWLLLVTYPSISRKILMLFKCVEIGKESYMMWDTQISCFSPDWWYNAAYASLFAIIYIVGVPIMFFTMLHSMRMAYVKENTLEIESQQSMKLKFLKLAKADSESRQRYWAKIRSAKDEAKRIADYLQRLNLRDEKNRSRLGFLYKFFQEEYYWFEMFEFIFKLCMTGLMVHVAPGTVSQILVGMLVTFVGFGFYIAAKPYTQKSNNILMIFGKFQLFLTLFGALLLKMETPFFANDSQMNELDVSILGSIIVYSNILLLVIWLLTVCHDVHDNKNKQRLAKEDRERRQRNKLKFKLLNSKSKVIGRLAMMEGDSQKMNTLYKRLKQDSNQHTKHKKGGVKVRPVSTKNFPVDRVTANAKSKIFWQDNGSIELSARQKVGKNKRNLENVKKSQKMEL